MAKDKNEIQEEEFNAEEYEEVAGMQYWLPETEGEMLIGEIVKIDENEYGRQYQIKRKDDAIQVTPSHKFLQNRLEKFKEGDRVAIRFEGEEPPKVKGQSPMKVYKVFKPKE